MIDSSVRASTLVIDDEPGLRDVLSIGLPKKGSEVSCAPSGDAGLALARERSDDIGICDIMMPGVDGLNVLDKMKEISPSTQVIMATGFASLETAIGSMKKGAYDYIAKPFSLNNLCMILEKALE